VNSPTWFTLIGRQADLQRELEAPFPSNVSCLFASDVVEMTDHPRELCAGRKIPPCARHRPGEGPRRACLRQRGKYRRLDGTAHFVLKMLPGVERPAIVSVIPSRGGHTYMLDLGANASCTPEQLYQFA